jgi:hypothetical protein
MYIYVLVSEYSEACLQLREMIEEGMDDLPDVRDTFVVVNIDTAIVRRAVIDQLGVTAVPALVVNGSVYEGQRAFSWLVKFEHKLRKLAAGQLAAAAAAPAAAAAAAAPAPHPAPPAAAAAPHPVPSLPAAAAATAAVPTVQEHAQAQAQAQTRNKVSDIMARAKEMEQERELTAAAMADPPPLKVHQRIASPAI